MKSIIIQIIIYSYVLLLTACYSKEPLTDTDIEAVQSPLVGITQEDHFTPDELCEAMANSTYFNLFGYNGGDVAETSPAMKAIFQMMVNPRLPKMDSLFVAEGHHSSDESQRLWQVESYAFSYKSTSAQGKEITLSGRVTFPNSMDSKVHIVNTLSLCNHTLNTIPEITPSMALTMYPMRIFHNSAVIEPDYEGYGVNDDGHAHSGFSFQILPVQLRDCMLAARQVMKQRGVTLAADGCSTGWGTSQGAAATIAFSRYYDQEASEAERRLIRLHSSYASEGLINPVETYDYVSRHPDFNVTLLHVTAAYLSNLTKEQLGGYDFEEFFPDEWRTRMLTINGTTKSYHQFWLANRFFYCHKMPLRNEHKQFTYNFVPEMTMADGSWDETNPKTKAFVEAVRQQTDWGEWIPVTPPPPSIWLISSRMTLFPTIRPIICIGSGPRKEGVYSGRIRHSSHRVSLLSILTFSIIMWLPSSTCFAWSVANGLQIPSAACNKTIPLFIALPRYQHAP